MARVQIERHMPYLLKTLQTTLCLAILVLLSVSTVSCDSSGRCLNSKSHCDSNRDCCCVGEPCKSLCDLKLRVCHDDCTFGGSTCDLGNKCDRKRRRCVCVPQQCKSPQFPTDSVGCHPVKEVCAPICKSQDDCPAGERCEGNPKFCMPLSND